METVTFKNMTIDIAADLHFPYGFDKKKKYAAIVAAHPIGSCKEQTVGAVYGKALAEAGFVVLAFDAGHQGASGGEPRMLEDPGLRVEDFRCAVDYLVTLDYVDDERIGVLGMCGGGGYAIKAAMTERRFRAVGTVVAVNLGRMLREGGLTQDPVATLEAIAAQRTAEARGAAPKQENYIPTSVEAAKKQGVNDVDLFQATEYYKTDRGAHPHALVTFLLSHQAAAFGFDAFGEAERLLTQPLQIVVGEIPGAFGSYRDGFELFNRARSEDKDLYIIAGTSHYDLYWEPKATKLALDRLIPFYKKHLA